MSTPEDAAASVAYQRASAMVRKTNALRAVLERREPRCRICRDESLRVRVNQLLAWHGIPIILGPNKVHVITYVDILRDLEPLNRGRAKKDWISYHCVWVHAKRHYDLEGLLAYWGGRVGKEFRDVLGIPAWGPTE